MYQLTKITLSKFLCTPSKITLEKPTITTESPICPFDFYVESNSFVAPAPEVHHLSTVWEMATDIGFTNVIATVESVDDKEMVLFPSKLIKENTTYYLRAYFVTDYGDTEWSEIITVTTNIIDTISPPVLDIRGSSSTTEYWDATRYVIADIDRMLYRVVYDPGMGNFVVGKWNGLNWTVTTTFSIDHVPITSTDPNFKDTYSGDWRPYINDEERTCGFSWCTNGTSIFFVATLFIGEMPRTLQGIYLFEYNIDNQTLNVLSNDNTGLFKRDGSCIFYYENEIFIQGGYQLNATGELVTPADEERTFIKYNLTTETFSEVILTDTLKPRNYRYSQTITIGRKSYLFGGHGMMATSVSPEFWCFDHDLVKWVAMPMYFDPSFLQDKKPSIGVSLDGFFINLVLWKSITDADGLLFDGYLIQFDLNEHYWGTTTVINRRIDTDMIHTLPQHISIQNDNIYAICQFGNIAG